MKRIGNCEIRADEIERPSRTKIICFVNFLYSPMTHIEIIAVLWLTRAISALLTYTYYNHYHVIIITIIMVVLLLLLLLLLVTTNIILCLTQHNIPTVTRRILRAKNGWFITCKNSVDNFTVQCDAALFYYFMMFMCTN